MSKPAGFQGFGPQTLNFFRALGFHQTREWMAENKAIYETQVRAPMGLLLDDVSAELARREVPLRGTLKTSMFRINRDVRFSKDKAIYKTNASAVLTRSGTKAEQGLVYIHVDPSGSFMACGIYHPMPLQLAEIRQDIVARKDTFRQACNSMDGLQLSLEDSLTRAPRGYDQVSEPDLAAALRLKSLTFHRPIEEAKLFGAGLAQEIADFAEQSAPFLRFCWSALDRVPLDERTEAPRKGKTGG